MEVGKVKVKTDYNGCSYITAGKTYDVICSYSWFAAIIDDEGDEIIVGLNGECSHLGGVGRWQVVE